MTIFAAPAVPSLTPDSPLPTEIKLADTWLARLRGLLGSAVLLPHQGLLISPCHSIHTMGMKYALDIVFLAQDGTILKLVAQLPPWRWAVCWSAHATLELAAGHAAGLGLAAGQCLAFTPSPNRPGYAALARTQGRP